MTPPPSEFFTAVRRRRRRLPDFGLTDDGENSDEESDEQPSCSAWSHQRSEQPPEEVRSAPKVPSRIPPMNPALSSTMPPKHPIPVGKTRRRNLDFRLGSLLLTVLASSLLVQQSDALQELRCGPVDIRNRPRMFKTQFMSIGDPHAVDYRKNAEENDGVINCTVIEGSFAISFINDAAERKLKDEDFPRFPYLREITGSLLIFETNGLTTLRHMLPSLRVIGGQNLIQHYSVIIYRNHALEELGLTNLRVIRNGGVRIMDNKLLCHTQTIDWKRMILSNINDVIVDNAAAGSVIETGKLCKQGICQKDATERNCTYMEQDGERIQSCWTDTACMPFCEHDYISHSNFGPGCSPSGERCHEQCLGGCTKTNDASSCHACRNFYYQGRCVEKCDSHLFTLLDRRCVTEKQCLALKPMVNNMQVRIKATAGLCSDRCPEGYEVDANKQTCNKCDGECTVVCSGDFIIDTFPKAIMLKRCNIIDGSLTIEMRTSMDMGMANELADLFQRIRVIRGYLQVLKSPPFLSLQMFKSLQRIEGSKLFNGKYSLSVIENQNLRKLFDPAQNLTILNGSVQFHNNRMLCFREITKLMGSVGKSSELNEQDQSLSSNGDKAICQDARIDVKVRSVTHDAIVLEWKPFNTSDIDHRKFLGYEIFYKEVPFADPKMSIDDDRSACVDSWSSVFKQYIDEDVEALKKMGKKPTTELTQLLYADQRIRPYTTYAFYIATQIVHHPDARNGISNIGFVTTAFFKPEPPLVMVEKVTSDSIHLRWDPPVRPNGDITHYLVTWREIDIDSYAEANHFCYDDTHEAKSTVQKLAFHEEDEDLLSSPAPSLLAFAKSTEQCSKINGCCPCGLRHGDVQKTDECLGAHCLGTDLSGAPEVDVLEEDEEEDVETPSQRIRRDTAVFERQRKQLYREAHRIRTSATFGEAAEALERYKQFSSMIIATARRRRSIERVNEVNEMMEEKATRKPLTYIETKKPKTAKTTTTEMPATAVHNNLPIHQGDKLVVADNKRTVNLTATENGTLPTSFVISGLKHFTTYVISVTACQDGGVSPSYCSDGHRATKQRLTKPLKQIDKVNNETISVQFLNDSSTLHITWEAPTEVNGGIKGYLVTVQAEGKTPTQQCVAAKKGWSAEENGTIFRGLADGQYRIQVIANSLHGKGEPAIRYDRVTVYTPGFFTWERILVMVAILLILIAIGVLIAYHYVRKHYGKKVKAMADFMQSNPEYCLDNVYIVDDWELADGCITLSEQIGEGSFGKVYVAEANNVLSKCGVTFGRCAVKINTDDMTSSESMNYLMEASIMKNFDTPFIVKLYGVISSITPAWVVMEMMERGNLRDYLRSRREDEVFNEMDCEYYGVIPRETFHEWAAQISDGMAYLESLKFVHRDLAARNCMIDQNLKVKIGDFGMARDLFYHEYYKPSGKRLMPVRWMSPESLKDGKFDSKSDMWSFGIVLYEMMTLGAQPYIGLSNDEVLNYIGMARKTIKKPECCSDYWYKIMCMCWRYNARDRPSFLQIVHLFAATASQEFKNTSFVLNDNHLTLQEGEELDMEGTEDCEVVPSIERRHYTDDIPMQVMKPSESTPSVHEVDSPEKPLLGGIKPSRQKSMDDEYALMSHSRGPSDAQIRKVSTVAGSGDGDYVERDVTMDVPTRRNTGASNSSYGNGVYCLANRGGSNVSSGFMENVRLIDHVGSGHLDESDYVEKDLSMDTRRSTGASTASYGVQPTWTANKGATYFAEKDRPKAGGGDRLTQLPGTGHLHNRARDDYVETQPMNNGSPSRNGNYCGSARGSFNGQRTKFGENDRLPEDNEHPLN